MMSVNSFSLSRSSLFNFFSILFVVFFILGTLQAEDNSSLSGKRNQVNVANFGEKYQKFFDTLKDTFTKEGGSPEGLSLLQKSFNTNKEAMTSMENEIIPLRDNLEKIITSDNFNEKSFMEVKTKINNIMIKSINARDIFLVDLFKKLNNKDRIIVANILKKSFER